MIFLHHIRRTGGRSLIFSILGNFAEEPKSLYSGLTRRPILVGESQLICGWNPRPPDHLFFGWSHAPARSCKLVPDAFTITILRDPIERVLSHYRLLKYASMIGADWGILPDERKWGEGSLEDFLDRVPIEHLFRQVFMFSRTFDPAEAAEEVGNLSFWFFLYDMERALGELGNKLGLTLKLHHVEEGRGFTRDHVEQQLTPTIYRRLQILLAPEYAMLERLGWKEK